MAKAKQIDTSLTSVNVTKVGRVLYTDCDPSSQPSGTHRFALNAINETDEGDHGGLGNERANYLASVLTPGFYPIGDTYIEDDMAFVISVTPDNLRQQIGTVDKSGNYNLVVDTKALNLKITNQCDVKYRLRRGHERMFYWVDALNKARAFNLDRPQDFYNNVYANYIRTGGNPLTFVGEKWDANSFDLNKSYSQVPFFSNVQILETGSILPGSYNFAIQYVDEDSNPTEWINVSNTVNIFNDTTTNPYHKIRGSKNVQNDAQNFPRANKTIQLTLSNLDLSFPFYRIAIIRAAGVSGSPDKVLGSDLYPTSDSTFVYTGNDSELTDVPLPDILINKEVIFAPNHIEQLENRLLLANTKGKGINWCEFQRYASKIGSDLVTKEVLLNNIASEPNIKNAKSTFIYRGNMPGEVYSYAVAYLFDDGYVSPAFHIPGKSSTNTTSKMKLYELDTRYLDIHNCSTDNYWGKDIEGNTLLAKKVRHHRFPFRKDVSKPLYTTSTTSTDITKHRLRANVTLNPAWTPGPIAYPVDGSSNPIPIPYIFDYQVTGTSGDTFSGILTDADMGVDIVIYDDVNPLDSPFGGIEGRLDPASILATTYQIGGNNRFIISFTYDSRVVSSSFNDDKSEMFGIEFFNIEKPHPNVVGFYILRNERTEDDKMIIDNAVFGAMTEYQQYKSFGLAMPKRFYTANNCGLVSNSGSTLVYHKRGTWFWNPEFQFFNKKTDFTSIEVEGVYDEALVTMPTISNTAGSPCDAPLLGSDGGHSKGVYVEDVQAGTTYDPTINKKKNKDDDGFDLIIGYRNTNVSYSINNTLVFPTKSAVIYLNAASYKNLQPSIYYNVSVDNKIGEFLTNTDISTPIMDKFNDPGTNKNALIYGSMVRDTRTAYSNFLTRAYYKEHNNPIYFGTNNIINGIKIFNGDAQISAINIVTSVFYDILTADRAKKNKIWQTIVGVVLIVAAVAATIVTAGAASPAVVAAIGTLSAAAISYGVSLATSGIKFEQMVNMINTDYTNGLKQTVVDGGVFECIRDSVGRFDDTIRWFSDRVSNVYIESSVPFGLRSGLTGGVSDFIDAPAPYDELAFRSYLVEKFTVLDIHQGSGRLYKGYAGAEFYDMNPDYLRFNKQKIFYHLSTSYDCCSDPNEIFPTRIWNSQQSFQEEKTDNYRVFLPNNYTDIEGEHGAITGMYRLGNSLFITTKEGLWQLPQNVQERVTNEIVSFIGTGEFFSIPPRKVLDDELGSGGTQHKWATIKTSFGVVILNEVEATIYLHSNKLEPISKIGMKNFFYNTIKGNLVSQLHDVLGVDFPFDNNPANPHGVGYHSAFDTRYERLLITKRDYKVTDDKIGLLQLINTIPTSVSGFYYCSLNGLFYEGINVLGFDNIDYFENKSYTMSFCFSEDSHGWISYHSYIPLYYIGTQNFLYSSFDNQLWAHHSPDFFQTFYGKYHPFIVEYVSLNSPLITSVIEDISLITKAKRFNAASQTYQDEEFITFNKLIAYDSRRCSGEQILKVKDTQANPEDWYGQQISSTPGMILITRKEKDWNINKLRDYVIDYSQPFWSTNWNLIKPNFFIDKVLNPSIIDFGKPWQELQSFRDKYVVIRLKFDTFNTVNLILNYSLETKQISQR